MVAKRAKFMDFTGESANYLEKWWRRNFQHAEGGVTSVYDRHSYDNEKRQALETWGRKLESIITGNTGKVITF